MIKATHSRFLNSCPHISEEQGEELRQAMENGTQVSRITFERRIGKAAAGELNRALGYNRNFPIKRDWHVRYWKVKLDGCLVYLMRHSAIEHMYCRPEDAEKLKEWL